jgi:hypothetical protein
MPVLPSTLEYTKHELTKKLKLLSSNLSKFKTISQQEDLELHIDLVYPSFAKSRSVMSSLSLTQNLEVIIETVGDNFFATVHFMGLLDDVVDLRNELKKLYKYSNCLEIYIPTNTTAQMFDKKFEYFYWYDIEQIKQNTSPKKSLQMTVKAGISGQVLTPEIKMQALDLIDSKGVNNIIVDGGWKIEDCIDGIRMVSYSSLWKSLIYS